MSRLLMLGCCGALLSLASCEYNEVTRETGYKGKARVNPWLAAEKFTASQDRAVRSVPSWQAPDWNDSVWFVPAEILSNESFIRQMEDWMEGGGHLVLLVEKANAGWNDWQPVQVDPVLETPLFSMLERVGIELNEGDASAKEEEASEIDFDGQTFKVDAKSAATVAAGDDKPGVFASVENGEGRLTVLTDSRIFRNRRIGEKENAALLQALVLSTGYDGPVGFMRGSGLSLWGLLADHLWPVLIGLGVLMVLWLWKNFSRFGPVEAAAVPSMLRGYDHHLEALGDFQWRLDRGAALLVPLREQIVEFGQRASARSGHRDSDFFQYLADRAGISRERVFRALAETTPADSAILTRTAADLQRLLQILH